MKVRSLEELSDSINADMSWRRKELTDARFLVCSAIPKRLNTAVRQSVLLLYAHWEGFVKNCASSYLCFVGYRRLKFKDLPSNLMALVLREELRNGVESKKIQLHINAVEKILTDGDRNISIPTIGQISAESNLKYRVLEDILLTLGLDLEYYALKENLIDEKLLKTRNEIAHGEYVRLSRDDYLDLHDKVLLMLNAFKTDVENAACTERYKKAI